MRKWFIEWGEWFAKMYQCVEAPKIGSTTRGIPTRSGPWLAAPYPFGIAGPTRDNGTSFAIYGCVCVELDVADLTITI